MVTDKSLVLKQPLLTIPMPMHALNPVCHRLLQKKGCQRRWMLNEEYQYSIERWASKIGSSNMLINRRGNCVPYPKEAQFRSKNSGSRLAFGFWTRFQQETWKVFLTRDVGPCYLDAVFDFEQNGFQMWTLLFEYGELTIPPVSFLITTSLTTRLLSDWLAEIASANWDVRYSKYYITQELRELVLRASPADTHDEGVVWEVQQINARFLEAFRELRKVPAAMAKMNYIFSKSDKWVPTSSAGVAQFNHSSDALSRWRYLLWMMMLGRPTLQRIDLVLAAPLPDLVPFSMDAMESGGSPLHVSVCELRRKDLGGSLVCLTEDIKLSHKVIVDLELQVCFCDKFRQNKICAHLMFCTPAAVHYPALPRLLQDIPSA
ncbi:hypothetical protein GGI20_004677 [Coemansia sp. BCRC 34301]|nr:hypothetical protein GGI20_004677 [Coemansia sp. BCRC 34301]